VGSLRDLKTGADNVQNNSVQVNNTPPTIQVAPAVASTHSTPPALIDSPVFEWAYGITFDNLPGADVYVASVSPLTLSNNVTLVVGQNSDTAIAGKEQHGQILVEFKEYVKFDVLGQLLKWRQKVFQGIILKSPSVYKCKGELRLTDGTGLVVGLPITLLGCWPSSIEISPLHYSGKDIISILATIEVDSFV
jgi:hypothetical protein